MSLFDSLYGDPPAEPSAPGATPEGPPAEGPVPAPVAIESPTMSLQDFATEVFGNRAAPSEMPVVAPALASDFMAAGSDSSASSAEGTVESPDPDLVGGDVAAATSFAALSSFDSVSAVEQPVASPHEGSVDTLTAPSPFATSFDTPYEASPAAGLDPEHDAGLGGLPPGNDGATIDAGVPLDAIALVEDDLLPVRRPKKGFAFPGLSGDVQFGKTGVLILLALVSGFFGYKTFLGSSGGSSDQVASAGSLPGAGAAGSDQSNVAGPGDVSGPASAIDAAQLVAAETELRTAALDAQTHFAEAGTYAQDAAAWDAVIGQPVVAVGAPLAEGTFQVVSDEDAACFQTATTGGASVAVGVTGTGLTFATDPAGASLCTADAAALSGWAVSLSPLG